MKLWIVMLAGLSSAAQASAASVTDVEAIDRLIAQVLGRPVGSPGGATYRVDPRLKLAACPEPLTVEQADGDAVDVRCRSVGWTLRVPILGDGFLTAKAPPIIRRGDAVTLSVQGAGFEIVMAALALDNAAVGQGLRVKSLTDGATLHAMAKRPGLAMLND